MQVSRFTDMHDAGQISKPGVEAARWNSKENGVSDKVFVGRLSSEEFVETWKEQGTRKRLEGLWDWSELRCLGTTGKMFQEENSERRMYEWLAAHVFGYALMIPPVLTALTLPFAPVSRRYSWTPPAPA